MKLLYLIILFFLCSCTPITRLFSPIDPYLFDGLVRLNGETLGNDYYDRFKEHIKKVEDTEIKSVHYVPEGDPIITTFRFENKKMYIKVDGRRDPRWGSLLKVQNYKGELLSITEEVDTVSDYGGMCCINIIQENRMILTIKTKKCIKEEFLYKYTLLKVDTLK